MILPYIFGICPRYFGNNASCSPDNKKDNQDETPSNLLRDVSNTMEDGSDQEFDMMKVCNILPKNFETPYPY